MLAKLDGIVPIGRILTVAATLVTFSEPFETVTVYVPASLDVTLATVYVALVAPDSSEPFLYH